MTGRGNSKVSFMFAGLPTTRFSSLSIYVERPLSYTAALWYSWTQCG